MKTPLTIGKKSNNDPAIVWVEDLPHLFVSWSERDQLEEFYKSLFEQLLVKLNAGFIEVACCMAATTMPPQKELRIQPFALLTRDAANGLSGSRLDFLTKLRKELGRRQQSAGSTQTLTTPYLKPLIILVDDLIDLVITRNKLTGLLFLELMRQGPSVKMHFIMGSTRSYRGLVRQLVQFENEEAPSLLDNYLPELVISPEELFFYKRPEELNYTRLFSLKEGEKEAGKG